MQWQTSISLGCFQTSPYMSNWPHSDHTGEVSWVKSKSMREPHLTVCSVAFKPVKSMKKKKDLFNDRPSVVLTWNNNRSVPERRLHCNCFPLFCPLDHKFLVELNWIANCSVSDTGVVPLKGHQPGLFPLFNWSKCYILSSDGVNNEETINTGFHLGSEGSCHVSSWAVW